LWVRLELDKDDRAPASGRRSRRPRHELDVGRPALLFLMGAGFYSGPRWVSIRSTPAPSPAGGRGGDRESRMLLQLSDHREQSVLAVLLAQT